MMAIQEVRINRFQGKKAVDANKSDLDPTFEPDHDKDIDEHCSSSDEGISMNIQKSALKVSKVRNSPPAGM